MTTLGLRFVGAWLVALVCLVTAPAADASGDPTTNSEPHLIKACGTGVVTFSDACLAGAFSDFNAARAKEGLGELRLPSNFRLLSTAQQLFVLANIDRVDRGLAPIAGLSSELNTYAQGGADTHSDPNFPGGGFSQGGSNWASTKDPLWSEFLWMYDDGPGSGNLGCVNPGDPDCWGHRHNILGGYSSPAFMGAAVGTTGNAELFLGGDTRGDTGDVLTWAAEAPFLKHPITAGSLSGSPPGKVKWKSAKVKGHLVKLRWKAPAGEVTGYHVTAGKKSWDVTKPKLRAHLQPGVYHFRVRAQNDAGTGPRSKKLTIRVRQR